MAELARTPAAERRLFRLVDLAPMPQHQGLAAALEEWRHVRRARLLPDSEELLANAPTDMLSCSFVAEPQPERDFRLSNIGPTVRQILSASGSEECLKRLRAKRCAVRLRHLFQMALERGEAIAVRFDERNDEFEALALPAAGRNGSTVLFCSIARDTVPRRRAASARPDA